MAKKVKAQAQIKKKKKIWVQINSPKIFGQKKIGETNVYVPGDAVGKTVEQNLMNLTGDMKKQNITVKFQIDKVTGTVAQTKIVSYKMAPAYIKRLVRRRRDRIDTSKVYTTKDNVNVRIKPLVITTNKTRGSTLTALRKMTNALIEKRTKQLTFAALVEEIISFKFQGYIKNHLKKIHPLRNCDIRVFDVENDKNMIEGVQISDSSAEKESEEKEASQEEVSDIEEDEAEQKEDEEETDSEKDDDGSAGSDDEEDTDDEEQNEEVEDSDDLDEEDKPSKRR